MIDVCWSSRLALHPPVTCVAIPEEPCYSSKTLKTTIRRNIRPESQPSSLGQQMSLRSSVCRYLENDFLRLMLWLGPLFVQHRHNGEPDQPFDIYRSRHGYGITLAAACNFYRPLRVELAIYLLRSWNEPTVNFSINWSFSCPRIVSRDDDTFKMAFSGDVDVMQERFSRRSSTPNDTLSDGWSLLHVRNSPLSR